MQLTSYQGRALSILDNIGASIGDLIEIKKGKYSFTGILMPTYSADDSIVVLKLENGYNIGISVENSDSIRILKKSQSELATKELVREEGMSEIKIISTGGTIVSKIEYETGAVRPALSTKEILNFIPEIKNVAKISSEVVFSILSEDMKPEYWIKIADAVKRGFDQGNKGIVVAHGTDTMTYTAAALAFSLKKIQGPVVLVGSQRSSDRPSSDATINLYSAVYVAKNFQIGEVVINMHSTSSDTYTYIHRGVKTRKMHTSRRDAFQSINDIPIAKFDWAKKEIVIINKNYKIPDDETLVDAKFSSKAFLLKAFPGLNGEVIDAIVGSGIKGMIIEGTGLGHISSELIDVLKKAIKDGVFIGMTSQCLFGRVNMNVYTTGRTLQKVGVTPLDDMLPEVALVKLMWTLAHYEELEDIKKVMRSNLAGELSPRHVINEFPRWEYE
ncbi:glutamyl-tRNA(Gln) amidotransferase subunit D [Sulfolobales archaeon HS-7]|nr:glutamyl-tRNA(Gln) amidotransferase subunit D [Sulfolobales archaeon HS-7]